MTSTFIYNPEGSTASLATLSLSPLREDWRGATVGILANVKHRAFELMQMTAARFRERFADVRIVEIRKDKGAVPLLAEQFALLKQCDIVFVGSAD